MDGTFRFKTGKAQNNVQYSAFRCRDGDKQMITCALHCMCITADRNCKQRRTKGWQENPINGIKKTSKNTSCLYFGFMSYVADQFHNI